MEAGYYEISFPDKAEYEGREMSFEVRSNRPGVSLYTVKTSAVTKIVRIWLPSSRRFWP